MSINFKSSRLALLSHSLARFTFVLKGVLKKIILLSLVLELQLANKQRPIILRHRVDLQRPTCILHFYVHHFTMKVAIDTLMLFEEQLTDI